MPAMEAQPLTLGCFPGVRTFVLPGALLDNQMPGRRAMNGADAADDVGSIAAFELAQELEGVTSRL